MCQCPNGAVRRAYILNRQIGFLELGEYFLYKAAVLAHNASVVAVHLLPAEREIHILVEYMSVECTERTESIGREQDLLGWHVGEHYFRPVYHRSENESKLIFAEGEFVAFFYL